MNSAELSKLIGVLNSLMETNTVVYVECDPEVRDFTQEWDGTINIHGKERVISFNLRKSNNLYKLAFVLKHSLFRKDRLVISWDVKKIFSYLRFHIDDKYKSYLPEGKIFDLKYCESYFDEDSSKPSNFKEALLRSRSYLSNKDFSLINKHVYRDLSLKVLPNMETQGVIGFKDKKHLYPYYEIEGQANGRLRCETVGENFINPHTLSKEIRENLHPCGWDYMFAELDFESLEGNFITWLTQDPVLRELSESGSLYENIHKLLFNSECDTDKKRKNSKVLFLSIMFGATPKSISDKFKIDVSQGEALYNKIINNFSVANEWFIKQVKETEFNKYSVDYFGRKRKFHTNFYKVRNFLVQSPAAMICLEKLVLLYEKVNKSLIFHIHDSYVLSSTLDTYENTYQEGRNILESESALIPGFKLKATCKVGKNLGSLKEVR